MVSCLASVIRSSSATWLTLCFTTTSLKYSQRLILHRVWLRNSTFTLKTNSRLLVKGWCWRTRSRKQAISIDVPHVPPPAQGSRHFRPAIVAEVAYLLWKSAPKFCELDPIPTLSAAKEVLNGIGACHYCHHQQWENRTNCHPPQVCGPASSSLHRYHRQCTDWG